MVNLMRRWMDKLVKQSEIRSTKQNFGIPVHQLGHLSGHPSASVLRQMLMSRNSMNDESEEAWLNS